MKPEKIVNRTTVYRAIYYSPFNWERSKQNGDIYTLKSKISDLEVILEHTSDGNLHDKITAKANQTPDGKDADRLVRLFKKILRRTKNLEIVQDLVKMEETNENN